MKKKVISALLCTTMLVSFMTGCGNKSTSDEQDVSSDSKVEKSDEKVTISYACWDSNQAKLIQQIADEFEKENPNIRHSGKWMG